MYPFYECGPGSPKLEVLDSTVPAQVSTVEAKVDPKKTVFIVASKTFTTIETMTNAASALAWLGQNGVGDPYGRVVALTAAPEKAVEWGVDETRVLPFPESVGGRYSLWSSIGFPIPLGIGMKS